MLELRKARPEDAQAIGGLYDQARAALRAAGVDQWQDGYPDASDAAKDIAEDRGFVITENGQVLAYACLGFGEEPTYRVMEQGRWLGEGGYGFLHRMAVADRAKVRGDTHRDNKPMQRVMAKNGLEYRGIIRVEDGTQRLAFEALLEK